VSKFSVVIAISILFAYIPCVGAREFQDLQFKFDASKLMPVTIKSDKSDALNLMTAEATNKALSFKGDSVKRGAADASIYQKVSAGTVLIVTTDGLGSGAVITNNGYILTNQHVVGSEQKVKVIFKPIGGSNDMNSAIEATGTVLKVNTKSDLALVRVDKVPTSVRPIPMKLDGPPAIGDDAHAVGHPRGEVWSYTRGYVSQYRSGYEWNTGKSDPTRAADVIQTQTPINPGNSGGPLVNSEGQLIGLNSFGDSKSPGLNFAIAISSIQSFLKQDGSYIEKAKPSSSEQSPNSATKCGKEPVGQKQGEWKSAPATLVFYDLDCKGRATIVKIIPAKAAEPIVFILQDKQSADKTIIGLFDVDRNGQIDFTLVDVDGDGIWDLSGDNRSGESVASDLKPIKKG
jgi:S1-C subfamily serine protease